MFGFILSSAVDAIISAAASFFVFSYLFGRIVKSVFAVTLSAVAAAAVFIAVYFLSSTRAQKKTAVNVNKNDFKQRMLTLYACSDGEIEKIFSALLNELHICANVSGRHITFESGKTVVAPLKTDPITLDDVISFKREYPAADPLVIISAAFSANAAAYCKSFDVILFSADNFGRLLDDHGLLPKSDTTIKKPPLSIRLSIFFKRRSGKRFLLYGAFLCALSPLVIYPVYYIVFGTVFVVYGLIAAFFGKTDLAERSTEDGKKIFLPD